MQAVQIYDEFNTTSSQTAYEMFWPHLPTKTKEPTKSKTPFSNRRRWTPHDTKTLETNRLAGVPDSETSKTLGRSIISVKNQARRYGLPGKFKRWTDAYEVIAMELKERGFRNRTIAKRLGRSKQAVCNKLYRIRCKQMSTI